MRFTIKKQLKKGIAVMAATAMLFTGTGMTSYAKEVAVDRLVSEQESKDAESEGTHSETDAEQADNGDGIALYNGDVAAYAANWADASNSYMQYYKVNGDYKQIDIQGYYNNAWLQTTYSNAGYTCVQENLDNAVIQATPSFVYGGRFVMVTYKVTAVNGAVTNGKLGIHADVQIGSNDYAAVTLVKENNKAVGFQMIDDNTSYASYNACFRLYFAGNTLGGSSASTYWMGNYSSRYTNVYNQTGNTEVTGIDSGIALSWQNINLAKDESKEYKIMLGVGTEKDLQDAIGSGTDYNQECIKDLTPGNYEITITDESGKTYYFDGVTESGIPFKGTDSKGQAYDFTGKKLSIKKKNTDGTTSKPSQIEVAERPQAPAEINMDNVTPSTEEKKVTLGQAGADQEYILVPEGTEVTDAMWENAQRTTDGSVTFTKDAANGQELDTTKKYVIYTRKYATDSAPKSDVQGPSDVIAFHHHSWEYKTQGNKLSAMCTTTEPNTCAYHENAVTFMLQAADATYTGNAYRSENVALSGAGDLRSLTGAEISDVKYYHVGADGTKMGTEIGTPVEVGAYVAEVKITADGKVYQVSDVFAIRYLDVEDASLIGTKGTNDWYVSNVTLKPEEGYYISTDGVNWERELTCSTQGTNTIEYYIQEITTGYRTDKKTVSFKIDTDLPTGDILFESKKAGVFGKFFRDSVKVSIEGQDVTSGISKIEYLKVAKGSLIDLAHAQWIEAASFEIKANDKSDIYARITDNAGNAVCINEEGIVVYTDASQSSTESFVRKATEDLITKILVNENVIASVKNGEEELPEAAYTVQDGMFVLKAEYLQTLALGTYTFTVSYNPLGEQFVAGTKPNDSVITLDVVRTTGSVTDIQDLSKTYDGECVKSPEFETTNAIADDRSNVKVEYKEADAADTSYIGVAPKDAGTYVVRVTVSEDDTYKAVSETKTFTIAKKQAIVTPMNTTKHAGMADTAVHFKVEGLVGTDTLNGILLSRQAGEMPGQYVIYATEKENANRNYEVICKDGTYTIEDHDWSGEWTVTRNATAKTEGRKEKTCAIAGCGTKKYDSIPKTGIMETPGLDHVEKNAEISQKSPIKEATLTNTKSELVSASGIFTAEEKEKIEKGAQTKVWLEISDTDVEKALTSEEKSAIEKEAEKVAGANADITYFNADLFKQVEGEAAVQVHEPGTMIRVTITIPELLQNTDRSVVRTYSILRMHDGVVDVIDGEYNEETGEFSFETDKFSTYAIVYKDLVKAQVTANTSNSQKNNFSGAPATGDSFTPAVWFVVMGVALLAILWILNKKCKEDIKRKRDEK